MRLRALLIALPLLSAFAPRQDVVLCVSDGDHVAVEIEFAALPCWLPASRDRFVGTTGDTSGPCVDTKLFRSATTIREERSAPNLLTALVASGETVEVPAARASARAHTVIPCESSQRVLRTIVLIV
jgi:hypothetical protein